MEKDIIAISEATDGEKALQILYMAAYFTPLKNIHLDMFSCLFNDSKVDLEAAIRVLKKKDLIAKTHNQRIFLVQKATQKEIRTFLKQTGEERSVLMQALILHSIHFLNYEIPPNYIDHALTLLTYVRESDDPIEISFGLPSLIVTALRRHNRLAEAYVFGKNALEFLESAVGETHAEILALRHNLATVLDAEGQHTKAVKVLHELNEKELKYLTVEEITKSLVKHARKLFQSSKYGDALSLYQLLLEERPVLDTFDSEILTAWHDYALLLSHMGRHSEANDILQDVVSQRRNVLVEDDEYVLVTRHSLANVFREQGNYIRAMEGLKEAFHESTKFHGGLHPHTLRAELDIVTLLLLENDTEEALKKLEVVEKKFKNSVFTESNIFAEFSRSHPDILRTRTNIVGTLVNLNEYDRALEMLEDEYEAYKNIFGEKHIEILRVKHNIGSISLKQRKLTEAEKILRDVYEGFQDAFDLARDELVKVKAELEFLGSLPTTLHKMAHERDLNKVVSLSANNVDINKEDSEGRRLLHHAASNGHISVAKYLLKMGAMYNAQDLRSATPYQLASGEQMKDLLNSVNNLFKDVKRGIQDNIASHKEIINARDKNGYSLLHWAVCNSQKLVVQQLLDAGADPKCNSSKGNTPLHVASSKGYNEVAKILLQSVTGNDLSYLVNYKTTVGGNTALHVAAKNNDFDMVKCLLMYGAGYDIENKEGLTPVQFSTDQSIGNLLILTQKMFSSVLEGNSEAITQLKSISNDELAIVTKTRNSQGYTLLEVAIENQHENLIHELLELL
ncbi:Ankyrin repeat and protein kinase domain-containing protein 1 [Araneus ventricosus]|uniref:Ankyrin repeat and protein kinase domain-containing protein 1 n=1 Tax=Araneus ventricosus TaxID=182803 RepID=A0A4Y2B2Y3_ARAVE|nr:Ankyrin repeat and protein kinase domain-containing protein 1 [Araneus ventricosus]